MHLRFGANEQKTGVLFAAAMEMAALAAGRPEAVVLLRRAAGALGQAFQLRDDLQDLLPAPGQAIPEDAGKSTLVALLGRAAAQQRMEAQLAEACAALRAGIGRSGSVPELLLRRAFPEACLAPDPEPAAAYAFRRAALPRWQPAAAND